MAETPSYTTVPGRIPELLTKVRQAGVPPKASLEWLKSLGFKSSNDRSLIPVLRQIGFVDVSNVPTPAWKQYRGSDHKAVLGRAVRQGYSWLYDTYPDAHERSLVDVAHVFSTRTDAGKQAIDKMVSTFKNLVSLAEFDESSSGHQAEKPEATQSPDKSQSTPTTPRATRPPVTVNVNVQLTLPETTDEAVFAAFFKAMRTYLLPDDS